MKGFVHSLEILEIALPFFMIGLGFAIIMGITYQLTAAVGASFIPHKVASMIAHSLTGNPDCLMYNSTGYKVKGVIDREKIDLFADEFPDSQPNCTKMPCWEWRAVITDFETNTNYTFGDDSSDNDLWENGRCISGGHTYTVSECQTMLQLMDELATSTEITVIEPAKKTINVPLVIQTATEKHLGKIRVQARPEESSKCNEELTGVLEDFATIRPDMVIRGEDS